MRCHAALSRGMRADGVWVGDLGAYRVLNCSNRLHGSQARSFSGLNIVHTGPPLALREMEDRRVQIRP